MSNIFSTVIKVSGRKENFDPAKITSSIWCSAKEVGGTDKNLSRRITKDVVELLIKRFGNKKEIISTDIGEAVEKTLIERGHAKTAKAYITYRENKKNLSQDKKALGVADDIGLSYNALYTLKARYLKRNDKGEIVETPKEMLKRVAKCLAGVEKDNLKNKWEKIFYELMLSFDFLPGTRTLANSGKVKPQLANCFVWPVEDDIDGIFNILYKSTLIKKHGGGCGYNFSKIRPESDMVAGIPDLAAGPVKMIEMFNLMTSLFKQEGKYESGNMAVLNCSHPDIFNFISSKQSDGYLSKTNISVGITDEFMEAAVKGKEWKLINPRTGEVVNNVRAKSILELMAQMAWATGDPGIINLSAMNKGTALANPLLKKRGMITATNPCGEVPLFPYESCNLGYVNLKNFVKDNVFDFVRLESIMQTAVRLMDNVIDASWFPVDEVTESVRNHRRIGIGCVGWAEVLIKLKIPFDSPEAYKLAEKIVKTMYQSAFNASTKLSIEKGPFPYINDSIWANKKERPRNVALLTFPPSSGNAVICETSFGIEPLFALAYEQNVMGGVRLKTVNPLFVEELKKRGLYTNEVIQKVIENHGSCRGINEIPKDVQQIFKVAHDIKWEDHIRMQASFQKWTDNAITKTVNLPSTATPDDIEKAYILAWKLGCKGITVYRDKSKSEQVFEFGEKDKKEVERLCPNCEIKLVRENKCYKCKKCHFSTCDL